MPRRRSTVVKKASHSWQGIISLEPKDFVERSNGVQHFFEAHLAFAKRLEVEIGCGSGDFLRAIAPQNPNVLFVGVEYASRFIQYARDQVAGLGLANVVLVRTDAQLFVRHCLNSSSVDAFHIYFPNPWPKRAQAKRRILNEEGLETLRALLKEGGKLFFATDRAEYFKAVSALARNGAWLIESEKTLRSETFGEGGPSYTATGSETHFGQRYLRQGLPIFAAIYQKL